MSVNLGGRDGEGRDGIGMRQFREIGWKSKVEKGLMVGKQN